MHGETSRSERGASRPSRRTLLTALPYAAGLALVSGCGVRLDLPQPAPPVPTRRRVPDEEILIRFIRDLREVAAEGADLVAAGQGGRVLPALQKLLEAQRRILVGRLTNDGVPRDEIDAPTSTPTSTSTPKGTSTPKAVPADTERLAARIADRNPLFWGDLTTATDPTRKLLFAATITRLAGAVLLGSTLPFDATAPADRAELVEQSAQLVYGFEVVAAQSSPDRRERARATLASLHTLARDLSGQPTASAWSLPFPVTRPADAERLATHLLSAAIGAALTVADGAPTAAALQDAATWGARVQALGPGWSLPLVPFPGTT